MKTSNIDLSFLDSYLDVYEQTEYLFLTNQNLPLVFVFKAINQIRRLMLDYYNVLNSMLESISYINNFEKPGKSTVSIETQILLSQANSSENIKIALNDYLKSLQNFKTTSNQEVAESNIDSLENIYNGVLYLDKINGALETLFENCYSFPPNINFYSLRKSLLNKLSTVVKQTDGAKGAQSPISSLINLISSFSFYENSIENYDVYSEIVSKNKPKNLSIYAKRDKVKAVATSNAFPQGSTSTDFRVNIDGTPFIIPFPSNVAQGKIYILSSLFTTTTLTTPGRLYIKIESTPKIKGRLLPEGVQLSDGILAIDFVAGPYNIAAVTSTINNALTALDTTGSLLNFGQCSNFSSGFDRYVVSMNSFVTSFSVIPNPGSWNNLTGVYTSSLRSIHDNISLAFVTNKTIPNIDYIDLRDCISYFYPITLNNDVLVIESTKIGETASITFPTSISTDIGFVDVVSVNNSISLYSGTEIQDPRELGISSGFKIVDEKGSHIIDSIDPITYISPPNKDSFDIYIYVDLVDIIKTFLLNKIVFPHKEIITLWTPIINNPLIEQINEVRAKTKLYLSQIQQFINNVTFSAKESTLFNTANSLVSYLEQKGYNKLVYYLTVSNFNSFFSALDNKSNLSFNQSLADSISNTKN